MTDTLEPLETLAGRIVASLDGPGRSRLARALATTLRRQQASRIQSQRDPGGVPFEPRRPRQADKKAPVHPVRFLYRSGANVREVAMKSYTRSAKSMTGFDIIAGGQRTFLYSRIERYLPDNAKLDAAPARSVEKKRGAIRRRAMFMKIRGTRFLKAGSTDEEVWAGFSGRVAMIARVSQDGLRDYVGKPGKSKKVKYPVRQLIGASEADRQQLAMLMLDHVST